METEIKRRDKEKERRFSQEKKRVEDRRKLEESIAARAFSYQFLGELHTSVFDMLEEQGHFYDPVKKEIEVLFMDDLLNGLSKRTKDYEAATIIAAELLEAAKVKAKIFEIEAIRLRKEEQARIEKEEKERKEKELKEQLEREAAAKLAELALEEGGGKVEE